VSAAPPDGWELGRGTVGFPECLEQSPQPPAVLYGIGDQTLLRPGLAVVGSRRATPYGLSCARMFAAWAAEAGVVIVSGAAAGCDQAAHAAALDVGGRTVAVLGCGPDVDYPSSAARILSDVRHSGAVVAEVGWGVRPTPYAFPRRNRIIASLSAVVLIVEAGLPSGTFSTADHALAAGREVVAVPGSIFFANSRGCNRLITQGAAAITDVSDLAEALRSVGLLKADGSDPGSPCRDLSGLDARSARLASALLANPMRADDVARDIGEDIVAVARMLAGLEADGIVARYPDGRYGACHSR
jgi:DNA processing protein